MDSKIDAVREALDKAYDFKLLDYHTVTEVAYKEWRDSFLIDLSAALSTIDPEAKIVVVQGGTCGCTSCPMYPKVPILSAEPAQDDGKPEVVMTMIENGDLSISWECSGCNDIIDDANYIESIEKCPHCGASIRRFVYIEEDKE